MRRSVDNATHSLVGLLVAEAAILWRARRGQPSTSGFSANTRWLSVIANNLGDIDSLYARRLGGKLGYLLQHRGYTHTVPVAFALGFGLWALWLGIRRRALTRSDRIWLLGISLFGVLLHIAFDFCNNYGVHPFWPLFDGWLYGDCLFIVEPWLWVFAIPALYPSLRDRWAKRALGAVLVAGVLLCWWLSLVPWGVATAVTLGTLLALRVCWRLSAPRRLLFALSGWTFVLTSFLTASRMGRANAVQELQSLPTALGESLEEVVMTPAPANPLCFSVITVSIRSGQYLLRAGRLSVLPTWLAPRHCRIQPTGLTLGLSAPTTPATASVFWEGEWRRPLSELRQLDADNCLVHALLGFGRAPFWQARGAERLFIGDLRFDRDPKDDFDELEVARRPAPDECLRFLPPWTPPRESLLRPP